MKILATVIVLALVIAVFLIIRRGAHSELNVHPQKDGGMTLEQKLATLSRSGSKLNDAFSEADLLTSWSRAEYEKPGFDLVLVGLGMTEEEEPWRDHCVNLWHFDTECIEDHGDYKRIVDRMAELTQGSLPLADIQDYVDLQEGEARFSFTLHGKETKVDCRVEDDWVDPKIFSVFVQVLASTDPSKVFVHYDLGGQDCLIGCVSREQLRQLNKDGINFVPLT